MPKDKTPYIAEFEELVILAILKLGSDAYGASIYEALEEAGRSTAVGALYTTLSRMEAKGLITSKIGESTPQRGGRPKKYFKVKAGALMAIKEREKLRRNLQPSLAWLFGGVDGH
jgi:PadR family transcriptional regulator, regulatory protein PadR